MFKLFLPVALAWAVLTTPACAQFNPLRAWAAGLHQGEVAPGAESTAAYGVTLFETLSGGGAQATWGWAADSPYRLGVGVAVRARDVRLGMGSLMGDESDAFMRNMYSLYAAPGYALGQSTFLYGKVAYLGGRLDPSSPGADAKLSPGLGLGAGMRTMLGDSLYLQVELLYGDYEWQGLRAATLRPASATGSVGLGWRF